MVQRLREEWEDVCLPAVAVIGCAAALIGLICYLLCMRSLPFGLLMKPRGCLPIAFLPLPIMAYLLLIGGEIGVILFGVGGRCRKAGGVAAIFAWLALLGMLCWLPVFFRTLQLFWSLVILLVTAAFTFACAIFLTPKRLLPLCLLFVSALPLLYLLWMNFSVWIIN